MLAHTLIWLRSVEFGLVATLCTHVFIQSNPSNFVRGGIASTTLPSDDGPGIDAGLLGHFDTCWQSKHARPRLNRPLEVLLRTHLLPISTQ